MSEKVLSMVKISVDALKKQDITLAKTISETEREVDRMYFDYLHKLINDRKYQQQMRYIQCVNDAVFGTRS